MFNNLILNCAKSFPVICLRKNSGKWVHLRAEALEPDSMRIAQTLAGSLDLLLSVGCGTKVCDTLREESECTCAHVINTFARRAQI